MKMIPYGRQYIDKDDIDTVQKVLKNDLITTGKEVKKFEKLFSKFVGSTHSVSCSSGTSGLLLAYLALGIKKNDVIIMPSINFIASMNMAHFLGAKIFLTDVHPLTGQMQPEDLKKCIKRNKIKKINTVIIMHNGGVPSDMEGFLNLKRKYKFNIIEDACHALGAKYNYNKKHKVGGCKYSELSVFSFHPVKHITTGEGGMVTTNNKVLFEKLKILRNHGILRKSSFKKFEWSYDIIDSGFNFRLSDIQCALGISQLKKLNLFIKRRRDIAKIYKKKLSSLKELINFTDDTKEKIAAYHLFIINLNLDKVKISRDELIKKLSKSKILTQVHYIPIFKFSFNKRLSKRKYIFKNAIKYFKSSLSIPIYYGLTNKEINFVCEKLIKNIK